jgi:hypothetical protein
LKRPSGCCWTPERIGRIFSLAGMDMRGNMGLYIRGDAARELAGRLAAKRGCTIAEAVTGALKAALHEEEQQVEDKMRVLREIQARVAALPELRPGFTDKDLYDEDGNPIL